MCWISRELDEQVAAKDITVYKVVLPIYGGCISLYLNFEYKFNTLYAESINIKTYTSEYHITKGFHSYLTFEKALRMKDNIYHIIVRCIIPKNAHYYINNYEEVVSDKIIIIG